MLADVPDAFEVDGTVVVPGPVDEDAPDVERLSPDRVVGAVRPLGFRAYTGPGYLATTVRYPPVLRGNLPEDSQVVADNGPAWLTCTAWPQEGDGCTVSVVVRGPSGGWFYLYGLGTDRFLEPGHGIEVFTDDSYEGRTYEATTIGGLDGTRTARVEMTLVDGSTVDATLDRGTVAEGDTLFWARTPVAVASVTAYDGGGDVVSTHRVRACSGGVDCEVR